MKSDVLFVSTLFTFGSIIIAFGCYILLKKTKTSEIRMLGLLFGANVFYILGYALELLAVSVELKLFFNHFQYIGLAFIVPIWLLLCLQFRYGKLKRSWFLLFVIPLMTLFFNLTHTINGLYYSAYGLERYMGFDVLVLTKGFWYFVEVASKTLMMSAALWLYAKTFFQATGMRRKQSRSLLILSLFGFLFSVAAFFGTKTSGVDIVCILLSTLSLLIAMTLYKHELFYLIPLAYSKLFDVLDQPILILSDSLKVMRANAEAKKMFSSSLNTGSYHLLQDLFDAEEIKTDRLSEEYAYLFQKTRSGRTHYYSTKLISLSPSPEKANDENGYLAVLTDTTSHIEQIRTLETLAAGDPLTGLFNRRHFFTVSKGTLNAAKEQDTPLSLIIFDVDHFKHINDAYGHQMGDHVLRVVSQTISCQLRSNDILGRFGGDEFVLLLDNTDTDTAAAVARRICVAVMKKNYTSDSKHIGLTIRAGVGGGKATMFSDIDDLMTLADSALYDAKSTGRNKVCVNTACAEEPVVS